MRKKFENVHNPSVKLDSSIIIKHHMKMIAFVNNHFHQETRDLGSKSAKINTDLIDAELVFEF